MVPVLHFAFLNMVNTFLSKVNVRYVLVYVGYIFLAYELLVLEQTSTSIEFGDYSLAQLSAAVKVLALLFSMAVNNPIHCIL